MGCSLPESNFCLPTPISTKYILVYFIKRGNITMDLSITDVYTYNQQNSRGCLLPLQLGVGAGTHRKLFYSASALIQHMFCKIKKKPTHESKEQSNPETPSWFFIAPQKPLEVLEPVKSSPASLMTNQYIPPCQRSTDLHHWKLRVSNAGSPRSAHSHDPSSSWYPQSRWVSWNGVDVQPGSPRY